MVLIESVKKPKERRTDNFCEQEHLKSSFLFFKCKVYEKLFVIWWSKVKVCIFINIIIYIVITFLCIIIVY